MQWVNRATFMCEWESGVWPGHNMHYIAMSVVQRETDLNLPESVVALFLSWSGGGTEVKQSINGVSDSTASSRQLVHHIGCIGVSREGLGSQE